jgi:hypothetical protein
LINGIFTLIMHQLTCIHHNRHLLANLTPLQLAISAPGRLIRNTLRYTYALLNNSYTPPLTLGVYKFVLKSLASCNKLNVDVYRDGEYFHTIQSDLLTFNYCAFAYVTYNLKQGTIYIYTADGIYTEILQRNPNIAICYDANSVTVYNLYNSQRTTYNIYGIVQDNEIITNLPPFYMLRRKLHEIAECHEAPYLKISSDESIMLKYISYITSIVWEKNYVFYIHHY